MADESSPGQRFPVARASRHRVRRSLLRKYCSPLLKAPSRGRFSLFRTVPRRGHKTLKTVKRTHIRRVRHLEK